MSFRAATAADEDLFYVHREIAESMPWYQGRKTTPDEHHRWYTTMLDSITLLVWNTDDGHGIARIESNGELAFSSTHPVEMLIELIEAYDIAQYGGRLKVTLDKQDRETAKALKAAGFFEYPVRFFAYKELRR